jgi:FKBP-type peptidyl-prolyl cis-trans isomerase FkpA
MVVVEPGAPPVLPTVAKPPKRRPPKSFWLGVLVGILLTLAIGAGVYAWRSGSAATTMFLMNNKRAAGVVETASGLQYQVLTPGKGGAKPTDTDIALVQYEGKLTDGTVFDKSVQPTPMQVGGVVPGFAEALKLMPKGSKYRFWLKPSLGYGDRAAGPIPANSILVFEVELLDFLPEAVVRQMQAQQQMMGAGLPPPPPSPKR